METERRIGPYLLLDVLGQGGMGIVYRAEHAETGRRVALKTVRIPSAGTLGSLRREIRALARLRHPGIVPILEEGVQEGLPWYAMELLEGRTLRGLDAARSARTEATVRPEPTATLAETLAVAAGAAAGSAAAGAWPGVRKAIDAAGLRERLTLLRRLCAPLAYLHGEGMVHKDLKPENILVRPDGRPVLVDFGLLSRFSGGVGRESLDPSQWGRLGTVAYMAPEQIQGEIVDARADLYSLGCILYECLVGRQPFGGVTVQQVLRAHLEEAPPLVSAWVSGTPRELDELVLKLLAKEPAERLGHAHDVAAALLRLGAEPDPVEAGPAPKAYLYRPRFAGREPESRAFRGKLKELRGPELLLVGGESGVGKTRWMLEQARYAERLGFQIHTGECAAAAGQLHPLRKLLQGLADRCQEKGELETSRLFGSRVLSLAPFEPALRLVPGAAAAEAPAELPPAAARSRLFGVLNGALAALARERPLLLLLDDLQWADELTLGWLGSLAHADFRAPILVLATYRTEELTPEISELLRAWPSGGLVLGRLGQEAIAALVGDMLALLPPPPIFSGFLADYSEGNPFFVAEYLRAAVEEGLLQRDVAGRWIAGEKVDRPLTLEDYRRLGLPHSLQELIGRRLAVLTPAAARLLGGFSVAGRERSASFVQALSGMDESEFGLAVSELLLRHVLEEPVAGTLRFAHDKLREWAYSQQPSAERAEWHRRVAELLASRPEAGGFADLGLHWRRAGELDKARAAYLTGARSAKSCFAQVEAESLFRAFLELEPPPGREAIEARNELAHEFLRLRGRLDEALALYEQSLRDARSLSLADLEAQTLRRMGLLLADSGRSDEGRALLEHALRTARASGALAAEAETLGNLGVFHLYRGLYEAAGSFFEAALELARRLEDSRVEAVVLSNFADLCLEMGRHDRCRLLGERALGLCRSLKIRRFEAYVLGILAESLLEQGSLAQARLLLEEERALGDEIGDRTRQGIGWMFQAKLARLEGRLEAASACLAEAESLVRDSASPFYQLRVVAERGFLELATGRSARASLEQARGMLDALRINPQGARGREIQALEHARAASESETGLG